MKKRIDIYADDMDEFMMVDDILHDFGIDVVGMSDRRDGGYIISTRMTKQESDMVLNIIRE